jgi:hypothetical protein
MRIGAAYAALLAGASAASAQPPPPDPATITLPDMTPTRDRRVIADGWKYFYFHKAGATYAEAYADFAECYRFLPMATGMLPSLPMFVPWRETPGVRHVERYNPYGLVGAAIFAMVSGPIERRGHQARLRRCMEPRGYVRYPLAQAAWEQLTDDFSQRSIALQALAAVGPTPPLEPAVTR